MREIRLTVDTVPVAQPRQRVGVIAGHAHNYTPAKHPVNAYKAAVQVAAREAGLPQPLLDGPLVVAMTFYLPRPKRLMRKKDPNGPIPHSAKPDRDNLEKSTCDALNGLVWRDDSQVYKGVVAKFYHEKNGHPRVEMVIEEM